MNFVIIIVSLFINIVFIYNRELLFDKRFFSLMALVSLLLFSLSFGLSARAIGNPKFTPALKIPFFALVVFFITKTIFFHLYQRNPEDTFWSMDLSLMRDGVFNFCFWLFGIMIPAVLMYHLKFNR